MPAPLRQMPAEEVLRGLAAPASRKSNGRTRGIVQLFNSTFERKISHHAFNPDGPAYPVADSLRTHLGPLMCQPLGEFALQEPAPPASSTLVHPAAPPTL